MVAGTSPNVARKQARERVAAILDAADDERRRREAERRKRITEHATKVAANDAEIALLTAKIESLHSDNALHLAAIVADGVSEEQAAAMTEREERDVKAAVKARAAAAAPAKKRPAPARGTAAETAAA